MKASDSVMKNRMKEPPCCELCGKILSFDERTYSIPTLGVAAACWDCYEEYQTFNSVMEDDPELKLWFDYSSFLGGTWLASLIITIISGVGTVMSGMFLGWGKAVEVFCCILFFVSIGILFWSARKKKELDKQFDEIAARVHACMNARHEKENME